MKKKLFLLSLAAVACVGSASAIAFGSKIAIKAEDTPVTRTIRFDINSATTDTGVKLHFEEYALSGYCTFGNEGDGYFASMDKLGRIRIVNENGTPFSFRQINQIQVNYSSPVSTTTEAMNIWVSGYQDFSAGCKAAYLKGTDGLDSTYDFNLSDGNKNVYVSLFQNADDATTVSWVKITYTC